MKNIQILKDHSPQTTREIIENFKTVNETARLAAEELAGVETRVDTLEGEPRTLINQTIITENRTYDSEYNLSLIRKMLFELNAQGFEFSDEDLLNELNNYQ